MTRKLFYLKTRSGELHLGQRTLIMGVLNVTPDSFSDGGRYQEPDNAFARAIQIEEQGADILDVGAESTRPGAKAISAAEELRRLIPVLKRLKGAVRIAISVDTYKAEVAEAALAHGADIINDPSGLTFDPHLAKVAAQNGAALVLNHMRGRPETWARLGPLPDVMGAVGRDLEATAHRARLAGVDRSHLVLDPGLGFGKRKEQNSEIIARLPELAALELPIMVGPSRKSFLAQTSTLGTIFATAAAVTASILGGAHLVRVHDVAEMKAAATLADEILRQMEAERLPEAERPGGSFRAGEPASKSGQRTGASPGGPTERGPRRPQADRRSASPGPSPYPRRSR